MEEEKAYIFLRHGKLDLPYADHSEIPFSVFRDLGTGALNAHIDTQFVSNRISILLSRPDFSRIRVIYASPSQRCQETASLFATLASIPTEDIRTAPEISEVHFDLDMIDKHESVRSALKIGNMNVVNGAVFTAMLTGKGSETLMAAYERADDFLSKLSKSPEKSVCITHDFLMRLIELRLRYNRLDVRKISIDKLNGTQRNGYLCGFATDAQMAAFEIIVS